MRRSSIVLGALAAAAALAAAWLLLRPRVSLPEDPLAAVPADAFASLRIRVDRVLASDAYQRLLVERGATAGVARIEATCGFNPLARLHQLVVFARPAPGGGLPRLAFVARGTLHHSALIDCAKKLADGDAATLEREEIEGIPAVRSKRGSSRAAFLGSDGIVGGDAESVHAAISTILGKAPSLTADSVLHGLYRELEQGSDITLVARVPDEARDQLQRLARRAGVTVSALEGLRALGLNLTTSPNRLAGGARLVTGDPAQARALVDLAKGSIDRVLAIPGVGMTPLAGVLRGAQMEARDERATFAGAIKVSTIEALLDLFPALEALGAKPTPRPSPADAGLPDATRDGN